MRRMMMESQKKNIVGQTPILFINEVQSVLNSGMAPYKNVIVFAGGFASNRIISLFNNAPNPIISNHITIALHAIISTNTGSHQE